ncbi:MAG: hypothetical protein IJS91_06985 [Bacteroidales bacterium]|nr:hypothetical protein [Bacteroidales bacterium]
MRTKLIIFALALLAFVGCVPDVPEYIDGIVLNLVIADPETRATKEGEEALNENVISERIDIFFYNETTGEITKEVLQVRRNGTLVQLQTNPTDIESIFGTTGSGAHCGLFVVANFTNNGGTYQGTPGSRNISDIKGSLLPAPTWENSVTVGENSYWNYIQSDFVMTGEMQLTLGNAQGSTPVYATVGMARVAAKVTFAVTVADQAVGDEDNQWIPDKKNMSVYMVYPMRKASLGAEPEPVPVTASATFGSGEPVVYSQYHDFILYATGDSTSRSREINNATVSVKVPVYTPIDSVFEGHIGQIKPFYSYPMSWETGSSMEPYMKLIIPWQYGNTTRKYYYKIPFHGNELLRNHWYHISIDVQILGTEQADPPQVTIHYGIAPWCGAIEEVTEENITSITSVPATVITARYLNVPTTEYVLYNEDNLIIPIQSSHDVEVVGFTVASGVYTSSHEIDANYVGVNPRIYNPFTTTLSNQIIAVRPNYSSATPAPASHSFTYNQAADSDGWSVIVHGRDSVTFNHPLKRDMSANNYDVAPYTIRMRLRHEGEGANLYFTDVIIEQRPSIIIKPEENSGGTSNCGYGYVNGGQDNGTNTSGSWYNQTINVDGSWTSSSQQNGWDYYLGSAPSDLSNSSNTNTNMYVIETSVLPTTGAVSTYMLGDPRSRTIDNLGQTWSQSKASVQNETRPITYYYPAGGAEYSYFIAPKFRIASSFGATQPMTFANAQRRCASYQEDGYPAGRWRLPTVAEITYMAQLTKDNLIPRLLGSDTGNSTNYWSNNGYVTVPAGNSSASLSSNTSTSGTNYVRCVYDEWYWEGTTNERVTKTTFTWGDEDRATVRKK